MNTFEVITKYLPDYIDEYFAHDSKTVILENGAKYIDLNFAETGYVKLFSMLLDGMSDYYRTQENLTPTGEEADYAAYAGNLGAGKRDGFAIGNIDNQWEIHKLQYCRGKQFRIDYISDEQNAGLIIGNALKEFHRLKVIPEVDTTRFSIIADAASVSLGNLVTEAPDATNTATGIIHTFNAAFEWLFENGVPSEEQVIFVNPSVMTLIRNTAELTKFLTQADYKTEKGIDFTIEKYGNRPIIEVPSDRFFTEVLVTSNGYRAQSTSKLINYMVVDKKAVVPIRKLEYSKVYGPEMSGLAGFHGYLINYLLWHGVVIPKNKVVGCYVSVSATAATSKVSTLRVDTRAGSVQNAWRLKNFFTNPVGMRGEVVYKTASAFTLGAAISTVGTEGTDYWVAQKDTDNITTGTTAYFALVAKGKIIAVSTQVTLVKHA